MTDLLKKPVVAAAIVALISIAILLIVNHTNIVADHRPPASPPGTTFNAAKDAGADVTPTQPASPLDPPRSGPSISPSAPQRQQ